MSTFIESLKRLYESGRATKEEILDRVVSGKITQEQYNELMGIETVMEEENSAIEDNHTYDY
nr:MAG TPA: hypothetical protein [Bacteriophage sp.]